MPRLLLSENRTVTKITLVIYNYYPKKEKNLISGFFSFYFSIKVMHSPTVFNLD